MVVLLNIRQYFHHTESEYQSHYLIKSKLFLKTSFSLFFDSILFVVCNDNIRAYSTVTGKFVRGLEGIAGKKIIGLQLDQNNSKLLYGCTENGDVISWKWKSGVVNEKQSFRFHGAVKANVTTFSLIDMPDLTQTYGLVTWRTNDNIKMQIGIFNLSNGLQEDVKLPIKLR